MNPALRVRAGFACAIAAATLGVVAPAPPGLEPAGQRMAAIFLIALSLWASEALPIAVTSLLVLILQPIFQVASLQKALTAFMSPVFFFVIAMFCITTAIVGSGLDRRFALRLLEWAGADSRRVVFALIAGTAATSTIVSDVPACAMFMAVALGLFERMGVRPGASNFGKAVMIGIPVASLIGGVATPAGSSINLLGIYFIEQHGNVRVPFLTWMTIGVPMVIALVPLAWWAIVRAFPPEMTLISQAADVPAERRALGPMTAAECKVVALLVVLLGLWVGSTWIPQLDVALVALAGAIVLFLPGMRLLTWEQAQRNIGWEALLMIGGVTSLGVASVDTGLARWLVDASMKGLQAWPPAAAVAAITAFTVLIHLPLPIGPVVNAVLIPPIVLLAISGGHHPALYGLPVAFTASCAFLLPLDAVPLITFAKGYYRMLDMFVPGLVISIGWVALMTVLIVGLGPLLGLL
ncbi:MAG: DASS family sodium-coupled anion symporter [Acidobacteria bacterium]|nr:DASS family sodium-coupled anion symporter [Acidobacteriota bacterium]